MATTSGVGSGNSLIDVNGLVTQLMTVERQALNKFATREQSATAQITAFAQVRGALADFRGSLSALMNAESFVAARAATTAADTVTASAGATAAAGSYSVEVTQLARQHRLASTQFASSTATIGSGTLNFQFGTWTPPVAPATAPTWTVNPDRGSAAVQIPAGTNTLAGVRDAVNAAKIGVTATIVNDGAGSRLVFTSKDTGAANALRITVGDADGNNTDAAGLSALAYDPANAVSNASEITAARNAIAIVDGITITSPSNTLDKALDGLSLTLRKEAPGTPATINVTRDVAAVKTAVGNFVKTYNDAMKAIADTTRYDPAAQRGSPLTGDAAVRSAQSQMRATLSEMLRGGPDDFTSLADIGLRLDQNGRLTQDNAKLDAALAADPARVARVFARAGEPSDARIKVREVTADTRAGNYAVNISTPATRGTLAGNAAAGLAITTGVNDVITFQVDGKTGSVTLPAGTYADANAFAADLQSRINGISAFRTDGIGVSVTAAAGVLTITSNRFGAASQVSASGSGAANAFGAAPVATAGLNVVGSVGGSAATGDGQTLTVTGGSARGLRIATDVNAAGAYGGVRVYEGVAARLDRVMESLLGDKGPIKARLDGLDASVRRAQKDREAMEVRLQAVEKRYRAQYTALDRMLSSMNSTSNYLSQQLQAIRANSPSGNRND